MAAQGTQLEKLAPGSRTAGTALDTLWTAARLRWAGMAATQHRWAVVSTGLLASLLGVLLWYGLRTDWRTLYAGLDADDARQVGLTLTQAQISFDLAANGTTIRVPAQQLDKARLATATRGGTHSGRMGFELFDKPNWVGSEFDEQVNYQRALEGELEHTVATLADIESARVHLVMPHDSLFRDQDRPAKATVVLKLRHAGLSDGEPDAIRNLVAAAVDGLSADRVVLVDAAGHLPLGPKTPEALRLSAEQAIEEKIVATLEPVTGPGNVRASVTLDYDSAANDTTEETYDPDQTATLSMQRTQQSTGPQTVASGVPGTASNAPNSQALPVYPRSATPPETASTESGTYGVSKTVRHTAQGPGRIRRMTAAIVVNDRLLRVASKGAPAQWQPWPPDVVRNLTALAQAAAGFDSVRGDVLTVEDLAFDGNRAVSAPSLPREWLSAAEHSPGLLRSFALLAALLLVLLLGVRPALRMVRGESPASQKKTKDKPSGSANVPAPLPTPEPAPPLAPPEPPYDEARARAQEIFDQVSTHLKREPSQSSRLLQSWIHSE